MEIITIIILKFWRFITNNIYSVKKFTLKKLNNLW